MSPVFMCSVLLVIWLFVFCFAMSNLKNCKQKNAIRLASIWEVAKRQVITFFMTLNLTCDCSRACRLQHIQPPQLRLHSTVVQTAEMFHTQPTEERARFLHKQLKKKLLNKIQLRKKFAYFYFIFMASLRFSPVITYKGRYIFFYYVCLTSIQMFSRNIL